jgi:hypothetical protein
MPWGMYLASVIFAIVIIAIMISEEVKITIDRTMFMLCGAAIMSAIMAPFFSGVVVWQLVFSAFMFESTAVVIFGLIFFEYSLKRI